MPAEEKVKVRFAPSPTGSLHVGNMRVALINWLFAKKHGGETLLRFDDTDRERSKPEYAAAITGDLFWAMLSFDDEVYQSSRLDHYDAAVMKLQADGRLYPCYETPGELERKRKRQMAQGKPPVYDRAALKLTNEDRAKLEAEGNAPHWRFRLSGNKAEWNDLVRGPQTIDTDTVSDPVLVRADGTYTYMLPSSVDDIAFGISHILRGEDHVTNTGVQIELIEALGGTAPKFGHFPLLVAAGGAKLSKREGGASVNEVRELGYEPEALVSLLAKLGTSDPVTAAPNLRALVDGFDLSKFGRAPAHYNVDDLKPLNADWLHQATYTQIARRLSALHIEADEPLWLAVRGNLEHVSDAAIWAEIVNGDIDPVVEDHTFTEKAASLLPPEPWDEETWKAWTEKVKAETGAKGKSLFMPLRLALTGLEHGPELKALLPLIGRDKALARLSGKTA